MFAASGPMIGFDVKGKPMSKPLPPPELLRKLLRYEPETGDLFWMARTPDAFSCPRRIQSWECNRWNSRHAGKEALASHNNGYKSGSLLGSWCLSHRAIWALVYGEWPEQDIDHINHIRDDNRLVNLRAVSRKENTRNQVLRRTNKSGVMGVHWDNARTKWISRISSGGKRLNLGAFDNKEDAVMVRMNAEISLGYHANHGGKV